MKQLNLKINNKVSNRRELGVFGLGVPYLFGALVIVVFMILAGTRLYDAMMPDRWKTTEQKLMPVLDSGTPWFDNLASSLVDLEEQVLKEETSLPWLTGNHSLRSLYEERPELFIVPDSWLEKVAKESAIPTEDIFALRAIAASTTYLSTRDAANWLLSVHKRLTYQKAGDAKAYQDGLKALDRRLASDPPNQNNASN